MGDDEIPLVGGRTTPGVVRVGSTVRRPPAENAVFVRECLRHLEAVGFPHAPRFLGNDAEGREMFSFVEGVVPDNLREFTDAQVEEAARILRRFHDATHPLAAAKGAEVICHGDASPCNFVFVDDIPAALIDFDAAHPGPRSRDVGYAAWLWLDIGNPDLDPHEVGGRLSGFTRAYGAVQGLERVNGLLKAQEWLKGRCDSSRPSGPCSKATYDWATRFQQWVRHHRDDLNRAVGPATAVMQDGDLRLRPLRLPADLEVALPWYADPEVLQFSEGGADEPYSVATVRQTYEVLASKGEVFIIEADAGNGWRPIGDVTLGEDGIPITIGDPPYRSRGFGTRTLALLVARARALGWDKLVTNPILLSNERSLRMFERAGFVRDEFVRDESGDGAVTMRKAL